MKVWEAFLLLFLSSSPSPRTKKTKTKTLYYRNCSPQIKGESSNNGPSSTGQQSGKGEESAMKAASPSVTDYRCDLEHVTFLCPRFLFCKWS